MRYMRLLPALAIAAGLTIVGAPSTAQATSHVGLPNCPETSQVCPPDEPGYAMVYSWARATTGGETDQLFDGTSLPSGWFTQYVGTPGGCGAGCNDTWSTANTSVGGGVVSMTTTCSPVGHTSACTSGGIGEDQSDYSTPSGTATAIEARVTGAGNNGSWFSDNVMQLSQYCDGCAWPPEVDFMENGTGTTSSFNSFLHCWSGPGQVAGDPDNNKENDNTGDIDNDGDEDTIAQQRQNTQASVSGWSTYEVDLYPSQILIYQTTSGVTHLRANWLRSTTTNFAGYYDTACNSYWPPTPNAALGIFLQSQLVGSGTPLHGLYGIQVDWVAQQPLA